MILRELIRQGENILSEAGIHDSANDARELLAYVTGFDRTGLIMYINSEITEEKISRYGLNFKDNLNNAELHNDYTDNN